MRTFIAIELPEEYRRELQGLQEEFSPLGKINMVKEFHLTLKFLGEQDDVKVAQVKELLNQINFRQFKLSLIKLGVFPNPLNAKVLWIGVKGNVESLQKEIDSKLSQILPKDNRFHPHITLGRIKFLKEKTQFVEKLDIALPEIEFEVKNFKLIRADTRRTYIYNNRNLFLINHISYNSSHTYDMG